MSKVVASAVLAVMVLTGCNTIKGLGRDVSAVGNKTTQTAAETQAKL